MTYFKYANADISCVFLGETEEDIHMALDNLLETNPALEGCISREHRNFSEEKEVIIHCYQPLAKQNSDIEVSLPGGLKLSINPNAYDGIEEQANSILKGEKYGNLYRFNPNHYVIFFVPKKVAEAMANYDWEQHKNDVASKLFDRELSLDRLRQQGCLTSYWEQADEWQTSNS